jgi:CheY-like chemotaxis protein
LKRFPREGAEMNEQEKIETYLSSVRHDMRSQLMVVREGASIILDNLVGSNCDTCFSVLRPALKSTEELNKLIGERLNVSQLTKIFGPLLSAKEEEIRNREKVFQGTEEELKSAKKGLLEKEEEMKRTKEALLGKEEELRSLKRELLTKEEELKHVRKGSPQKEGAGKSGEEESIKADLEMVTYELMGMISHVIRTPLAVVKESMSLVLDEIPGTLNPKQKELLLNGKKNIDILVQSVEELSQESWDEILRSARKHFSPEALAKKVEKEKKKRILVVEDQTIISNMLKLRLEANNYEVLTAEDGEVGLEKARKQKPNLIIMDIMLPKMNGYKVCQLLKGDLKYKSIPIIISSGRTPQEIRKVGKTVGADAFVSKPFEAEVLLSKIKELLDREGVQPSHP